MYVKRLLQINMATLAALGAMLLGMGQQSAALPFWVVMAAITSLWLTDVTGWFRLNRTVTNLAAGVALLLALWELRQLRGMVQILAIADLLVYLQIILLFQQKELRTYWQLAMLSLLQVVVAAVFNQGFLFGVLLMIYLAVGLSAWALLLLYGEESRYPRTGRSRSPAPAPSRGGRWPLAGQVPSFDGSVAGFTARSGVGPEWWGRLARIALGTLVLTPLIFFALPRFGRQPWRGTALAPRRTVGFSNEVALGEMGKIIESPEEVLRIRFTDYATDLPYEVRSDVYLRGAILTSYADGRWSHPLPARPDRIHSLKAVEPQSAAGLVRQKITIEPLDRQELFCVWPFVNTTANQELLVNPQRERLLRPRRQRGNRFAYELATPALDDGVQAALVPAENRVPVEPLLKLPATGGANPLPALCARAEQWINDSTLPPEDRVGRARYLERQLRDSGDFQYSLEGQPRDLEIDPIEDFITNNPRGHCEYFATALVLMLRSQGIPARLAIGYNCNEWNALGRFFQVRQLHAHAWVEVYLEPAHVPPETALADRRWDRAAGGWLRLDPTPAASAAPVSSLVDRVGHAFDWLDFLWANYVMEMDRPRQQEAVYRPLVASIKEAGRRLADPAWWRSVLGNLGAALRTGFRNLTDGRWFSWRGALVTVAALLLLASASCGLRLLVRRLRVRLAGGSDSRGRLERAKVDFYRRMETLLARHGLARSATQTQREFACLAGAKLAASTGQPRVADLPAQVAEAFYRVRFGGRTLDNPQAEAVEQALRRLEQAVHDRLQSQRG